MQYLTKSIRFPLVILTMGISLLSFWGCESKPPAQGQATANSAPTPVVVASVKTGPALEQVESVGNLIANEAVIIRPEIAGRIRSLSFTEGQTVTAGQVLVTLDPTEYEAQMAQAESVVTLWQLKFRRGQDLLGKKVLSKQEYDEIDATLKGGQANLAVARARLEKTTIRAPFSGTLGLRRVSPGDYVEEGQDLVNLESIDPIKVDLRVPERYASHAKPSQKIQVRVDAFPGKAFTGEVYAVDPRLDAGSRSVLLRGRLPNSNGELRPGMFARASLVFEERTTALWAPEQALVPMGNEQFVYRVLDGKAALTKVETGLRHPGEVEIKSGLTAEDRVITDGQMKLRDGMPVTVVDLTRRGDS
jgi:membrane fusion protein (multidrug efflux system)